MISEIVELDDEHIDESVDQAKIKKKRTGLLIDQTPQQATKFEMNVNKLGHMNRFVTNMKNSTKHNSSR